MHLLTFLLYSGPSPKKLSEPAWDRIPTLSSKQQSVISRTVWNTESPSLRILQTLHRLDRSSPRFHDKLTNVLYGEEYKRCVPILQGDDLVWLVDYMDEVRHPIALPQSPLKPV
jgi:hypothetical protein